MTFNEVIYELKEEIRRHNLFDDDRLDERLIKKWINDQRELWIRNEVNKNRSIDQQIIQTFCDQLEVADRSACPSYVTGYSVLQTSQDMPEIIELNDRDGIIEIGPVDRIARPFSYINIFRSRFAGSGKWNSKFIYAFRYGKRILLASKDMESGSFLKYLRYIKIRALCSDPEEVANFTHVNGNDCYSEDDDYPLNRWMWSYMKTEIKKANFGNLQTAVTDMVNDAGEDLKTLNNE